MSTAVELPSFLELGRAIRAGETTSEAATERCLGVIRDRDRSINAFIAVLADTALEAACSADRELRAGQDPERPAVPACEEVGIQIRHGLNVHTPDYRTVSWAA